MSKTLLTKADFTEYLSPFEFPPKSPFIRSLMTHIRYLDDEMIDYLAGAMIASSRWKEFCIEMLAISDEAKNVGRILAIVLAEKVPSIPLQKYVEDANAISLFISSMIRNDTTLSILGTLQASASLADILFIRCDDIEVSAEILSAKVIVVGNQTEIELHSEQLGKYAPEDDAMVCSSFLVMRPSRLEE
jgi:hypothetical protein